MAMEHMMVEVGWRPAGGLLGGHVWGLLEACWRPVGGLLEAWCTYMHEYIQYGKNFFLKIGLWSIAAFTTGLTFITFRFVFFLNPAVYVQAHCHCFQPSTSHKPSSGFCMC